MQKGKFTIKIDGYLTGAHDPENQIYEIFGTSITTFNEDDAAIPIYIKTIEKIFKEVKKNYKEENL